jgi:YD repeat-containing protein
VHSPIAAACITHSQVFIQPGAMSTTPSGKGGEESGGSALGMGEDAQGKSVGGISPVPPGGKAPPPGMEDRARASPGGPKPPRGAARVLDLSRTYQPRALPDNPAWATGRVRAEALRDAPMSLAEVRDLIATNHWQVRGQITNLRIVVSQILALSREAREERTRMLVHLEHLNRRTMIQESLRAMSEKRRLRSSQQRKLLPWRRWGYAGTMLTLLALSLWMVRVTAVEPEATEFHSTAEDVQRALDRLIDPVISRDQPPTIGEGAVLMALAKGPDVMLQALAARALAWQGYTEYDTIRDVLDYRARQVMYFHWATQRLRELGGNDTYPDEREQLANFLRTASVGLPRGMGNVTLLGKPVELGRAKRGHPSEVKYVIESQPYNGTNAYLGEPSSGRPPTRTEPRWVGADLVGIAPLPESEVVSYAPQILPAGSRNHGKPDSSTATTGSGQLEFTAYDCSYPQDMTAVTLPSATDCDRRPAPPITHESVQRYALLQSVPTTSFSIRGCKLRRSKMPIYCGAYDHQTVITSDIWHNRPVDISPENCRSYWRHQEIKVKVKPTDNQWREVSFRLALNDTTRLRYDSHGKSWATSSEGKCDGVEWFSEAQQRWVSGIVQTIGDEVTMAVEEGLVDAEGRVDLPEQGFTLPPECEYQSGECQTKEGTFVWDPQPEALYCPLFLARPMLNGTEIDVAEDGRITTIFTDNKELVRLVKKRAITQCGHQVHPTNFDNLFLAANPEHLPKLLRRPVPEHAVSLTTYFNQQSNWLRGYFDETVSEYMERLIQQRCRAEQEKRALEWAELAGKQAAITAGETISLGEGMFATATGEAWRYYKCRAIQVIGANRDVCYNALPVIASAADTEGFLHHTGLPAGSQLYMEPNTRMLTGLAVEFPCSPHLAALYRNNENAWVQATPSLLPAASPKPLDAVDIGSFDAFSIGGAAGPDFGHGGIYPPEVLRHMEDVRSRHRKIAVGSGELAKLVDQVHIFTPSEENDQGFWAKAMRQAVPELPTLQKMATGWFWTIFGIYGDITQFLVGTYLLYQPIFAFRPGGSRAPACSGRGPHGCGARTFVQARGCYFGRGIGSGRSQCRRVKTKENTDEYPTTSDGYSSGGMGEIRRRRRGQRRRRHRRRREKGDEYASNRRRQRRDIWVADASWAL